MPDRSKAPLIVPVKDIPMPAFREHRLANGVQICDIRMGSQPIIRLELILPGGRWHEHKQLASKAAGALWKEGTPTHSSAELAAEIDYYGASISTFSNTDFDQITLYCLKKHYPPLLACLLDILQHPLFPQQELETFVANNKQRLKVDLSKNDVVAFREFTQAIYGAEHPYGYNSSEATYDALATGDLRAHYQRIYQPADMRLFLSGDTDDALIRQTALAFEQIRPATEGPFTPNHAHWPTPGPAEYLLEGSRDLQAALAIGKRMVDRRHPDYAGLYVLNTVLGGYFGSRLMTNIREEKGYTYNIYSQLEPLLQDGYFYISTEVGQEYLEDTLREILTEVQVLRKTLIRSGELQMVKNYLAGNFLSYVDGPMNAGELIRMIRTESLPEDYLSQVLREVLAITPQRLRELAIRYLDPDSFTRVIVS